MTVFSAYYASILDPCLDGNMRTYATTKELTKKEFTINIENINQAIGVQVTIILELKLQKYVI